MTQLALVTGATSGIGKAYSEQLAAQGYDLIVVGRNKERLDQLGRDLGNVNVRSFVVDLSSDDGAYAVAEICRTEPLDLLINNAGVAHYMPISQLPLEQASELVHVKVVTPSTLR